MKSLSGDFSPGLNDAANVTIVTYIVGAYGAVGSLEADQLCISRWIPERLIASRTGALLYDESSNLWWNGSGYIAEMYKEELGSGDNFG